MRQIDEMMGYKTALAMLWIAALMIFMLAVCFGEHPKNAVSTTMLHILWALSIIIAHCKILELFV